MTPRAKAASGAAMDVARYEIDGPLLLTPRVFEDARGHFMEAFKAEAFNDAVGHPVRFVQDNQSLSAQVGTVRGLHYQASPHAQGKLVRVLSGRVIDVAVDVRRGSPTYGQHVRVELSAANRAQLWVPPGFLHGFATLEPDTTVFYKVTDVYTPDCDGSVRFDSLEIDWGLKRAGLSPVLSEKDRAAPAFADWQTPFDFSGETA